MDNLRARIAELEAENGRIRAEAAGLREAWKIHCNACNEKTSVCNICGLRKAFESTTAGQPILDRLRQAEAGAAALRHHAEQKYAACLVPRYASCGMCKAIMTQTEDSGAALVARLKAQETVVEAALKAYRFLEARALGGEITDELEIALAAYEKERSDHVGK